MDSQVRNFRDFLQLYNKLTEMCFQQCVDNFFTRDLSANESTCLDKCVLKFSNVNQRVMGTYIAEQSVINERRMKEVETSLKIHNEDASTAALNDTIVDVTPTIASNIEDGAALISDKIEIQVNPSQAHNVTA